MTPLVKHYGSLFHLAATFYLIPCTYNYRENRFGIFWRNTFAFVLMFTIYSSFLWFDIIAIKVSFKFMSMVMLGIMVLYVLTSAFMPIAFALNSLYHREQYVQLFDFLFARDDVILQCSTIRPTTPAMHHRDNLKTLSVFVILNCIYNVMYIAEPNILKLYWISLLRFSELFLMVELHRACANVIKDRMEQLQVLLMNVRNNDTASVEFIVHIFVERFQRYHHLIDSVNQCFSVPLTHILLLILLERTVASYDVYDNFYLLNNMSQWEMTGFLFRQLWTLIYMVVVFMIAVTSSLSSSQVEETALCTRHFDDYRLQNTRAAKQIQKFLLKNLHQKKKFSACGFFDIDNTVIYMVFSSIVTYLVILIQFKQLETDLTQSEGVFNVTSNLTTPGPS
uniref:Gustatory receptor n=1 Tax=Anopheles dirus TaxID=7168 RepID=A0A182NBX8_9DIPT